MTLKLVTGKLTEANRKDEKVIFPDGHVRELINNIDTKCKIINPPTLDHESRYKIYHNLNEMSDKIIFEMMKHLNNLNNVDFNINDWKIIIGPWLNNFLRISYNRFFKIKNILFENEISQITILNCDDKYLAPIDNNHLIQLANNDEWNSIFYAKIINYLDPTIPLKIQNFKPNFVRSNKKSYKSLIKNLIFYFLSFFTKRNDAIIINSYLPTIENIKLNLFLKQMPTFWRSIQLVDKVYNSDLREKITFNKTENEFENFVKRNIPIFLPTCHLELFKKLHGIINNLRIPKNPKFIFTSNNYEFDEVFKLVVVLKKKMNATYIIGQHGSYLAQLDNIFFKENYCADHYLDWGEKGFGDNEDGFNLKMVNIKIKNKKNGKILIVDSPYGTNNKIHNRMDENIIRENYLHNLLMNLNKDLHKHVVLKLHFTYVERNKSYISKIKSICPEIRIETDNKIMMKLIRNSRCIIHTYDSTGIYESMILNIPTFCIWPNKLNHVHHKYHKIYNTLEKSKILFYEPKKLAAKINYYFNDLNKWWHDEETIDAVNQLLEKFSKKPKKNSTRVLANKLLELSKLKQN